MLQLKQFLEACPNFYVQCFSSGMLDLDHEEKALMSESAEISLKRQLQYRRRHVANFTVE